MNHEFGGLSSPLSSEDLSRLSRAVRGELFTPSRRALIKDAYLRARESSEERLKLFLPIKK